MDKGFVAFMLLLMATAITAVTITALALVGRADANGGHGACDGGVVSIAGTADLVTYDASPDIVVGVCVKAGNTALHDYYTSDVDTGCYAINGVGTQVVTVTRLMEGRECQGLSHIDVLTNTTTPTPTPTPSVTSTPTPSPSPTPTPTFTDPASPTPTSGTPLRLPSTGDRPFAPFHNEWLDGLYGIAGGMLLAGGIVMLFNYWQRFR